MKIERLSPTPLALISHKDCRREFLIGLIEQWKRPYPHGLGDIEALLGELMAGEGMSFIIMADADFALLVQIIIVLEEKYHLRFLQEQLADEGSAT